MDSAFTATLDLRWLDRFFFEGYDWDLEHFNWKQWQSIWNNRCLNPFSGLQFLEWFHQVEGQLQRRDDAHIRAGVRCLERLFQESTVLVEQTEAGLNHIQVLGTQYKVKLKPGDCEEHTCAEFRLENETDSKITTWDGTDFSLRVSAFLQQYNGLQTGQ